MTRWLVIGAGGMLGRDLVRVLRDDRDDDVTRSEDVTLTALDRTGLDITDPGAVARAVLWHDVVVNAAAWTDVDGAETAEGAATEVNGHAVEHLAHACAASGARLLHVSTDYVFSGDATTPYPEDAKTSPISAYGRSKLVAEEAVLAYLPESGYVVRTAWLYATHGRNFLTTMLRLAGVRDTVDVVDDQFGQPTWSYSLARRLVELGRVQAPAGIYHATASGATSWFGFARAIFEEAGLDASRVRPTTSEAFASSRANVGGSAVRPARRPSFSVLGHDRWALGGLGPMAPWRADLRRALADRR
jgi:dTDP-4-dehydrorhamnose reductase